MIILSLVFELSKFEGIVKDAYALPASVVPTYAIVVFNFPELKKAAGT
jgi:hypothetical protein